MDRSLLRSGFVLLLLSLFTGLALPLLTNPRLGLSAHLSGIMSGTLLVVVGVIAGKLRLGARGMRLLKGSWIYSAYSNWVAGLLGAAFGASKLTPIAGAGTVGTPVQEAVVYVLLCTVVVSSLVAVGTVIWGLRGAEPAAR
jgi:hydroxylaminobenzene mutase